MATTNVVLTNGGISITVTAGGSTGTFHDGDAWCLPGDVVTATSPAKSGTGTLLRNGIELNLRGNNLNTGLDGRFPYGRFQESLSVTLPYTMQANDVLMVGKSAPTEPWTPSPGGTQGERARASYWSAVDGISYLDELMTLTCVRTAPSGAIFRPPPFGSTLGRIIRDNTITEATADYTVLPSVIDPNVVGGTPPDIVLLKRLFSRPAGDTIDSWPGHQIAPDLQFPGYGKWMGVAVSNAMIALCSTNVSGADKAILGRSIVQWGLDYATAFIDGRRTFALGGQMQGRKALILTAGYLLYNHPIARYLQNIDQYCLLLGLTGNRFYENNAYFTTQPRAWWFSNPVWPYGWRFDMPAPENTNPVADGSYLLNQPSQWTQEPFNGAHNSQQWAMNGYFGQSVGASYGQALGMALMGLTTQWSTALDGMVMQHSLTPGSANQAQIALAGVDGSWGTSYGDALCGASPNYAFRAWQRYRNAARSTYTPVARVLSP